VHLEYNCDEVRPRIAGYQLGEPQSSSILVRGAKAGQRVHLVTLVSEVIKGA